MNDEVKKKISLIDEIIKNSEEIIIKLDVML